MKPNIAVVYGTRPELIKLALLPAYLSALGANVVLISSGQHATLLPPIEAELNVRPDVNLGTGNYLRGTHAAGSLPRLYATLYDLFVSSLPSLGRFDAVVVQGDTATAQVAAHVAFLNKIPVAHVEAGLRSGNLASPFPEEANRLLISRLARFHYAPTYAALAALAEEHVPGEHVRTGNTVVDAALTFRPEQHPRGHILVTCHRNENEPHLPALGRILRRLASAMYKVIVVLHPRPGYADALRQAVASCEDREQITFLPPQGYRDYLGLIAGARVVLTDSGGTVEEASAFGRPSVIFRNTTERPEAVDCEHAVLAGHDVESVVELVRGAPDYLLQPCPFGDGNASRRIAEHLVSHLSVPG